MAAEGGKIGSGVGASRTATEIKAISVNKHTPWLVFSLAFFVAATRTENDYARAAASRRRTRILRHSVCLFPAIA